MLTLAAALLAVIPPVAAAPPGAGPRMLIEDGRIVQVSRRPAFGSGVLAVYADFEVAPPGGEPQRMYLLWMGGDQFLPDVGSVCTVAYRREALLPGNSHRPATRHGPRIGEALNVVDDLVCDIRPATASAVDQRGRPSAR